MVPRAWLSAMTMVTISLVSLTIWIYLLLGRGWFWRCGETDDAIDASNAKARMHAAPRLWPKIVAIVPARDEANVIASSIESLVRQDYPEHFSVIVVDDQSSDNTAAAASSAADAAGAAERVRIIAGTNVPRGWTGKLWAMHQGLAATEAGSASPEFVLFSDADITYAPHALRRLVSIARSKGTVLTSLMVKLRCRSAAERWLVPAFVFYFQKLYPFAWVNDPQRPTAAAAGGCMLVKREVLIAAGGLHAVRNNLIDDCALAALMKQRGPIWLGLTDHVHSLRAYPTLADFKQTVVRSAFAQLRGSPLQLAGAIAGMITVYLAPPFFAVFGHGIPRMAGLVGWMLMALSFVPTLRLYGQPMVRGFALPIIAGAFTEFTMESALLHWRGRGGYWKGRFQAQ
jgi:hopene-associated glycosyltransferase HpnB